MFKKKKEACCITYLHKPCVHEVTQRVQSPLVQSIGTQSWVKKDKVTIISAWGVHVYMIDNTWQAHTLVDVKFLHKSEDLFREHFGLDLAHAVFGHREPRELPVETHADSTIWYSRTRVPTHIWSNIVLHPPYLLMFSTLKLGWHHESSSVTSCCSKWLWPATKDSANGNLFCKISGTHI